MNEVKLLASVQSLGTAVQRALARNEQMSTEETDHLVDSLTLEVQRTIEALDRPGETPIGEDPFDYYTGLINGLTADIAALRQSDIVSGERADGLSDALNALTGRVDAFRVQTNPIDTTAGALMTVGAFGLGSKYPGASLDFNELPTLYPYSGRVDRLSDEQSINGPVSPSGSRFWYVDQYFYATGTVTQKLTPYRVDIEGSWMRSRYEGVWSPWRYSFHSGNVVGTVSHYNGVPTGAILERGANANGHYIRYADGTQICYSIRPANQQTPQAHTFPAAFAASVAPHVMITNDHSLPAYTSGLNISYTTWQFLSSTPENTVRMMTIGMWR